MAYTCKFVDMIDAARGTRLNLNSGSYEVLHEGRRFDPPALRKVALASMLKDGRHIPASAYDNRFLRLTVKVTGASKDALATNLQALHRELDRSDNFLEYQSTNATNPVFFHTYRSPRYTRGGDVTVLESQNVALCELDIEAFPFAFGLAESLTPSWPRNPSTPGTYYDITSVKGDVDTPLYIEMTGTNIFHDMLICRRHHAAPLHLWLDANSMGDGAWGASVADASAVGGAAWQITANPAGAAALIWTNFPSPAETAGNDAKYRGLWRIFMRMRAEAGATFQLQAKDHIGNFIGDVITLTDTDYRIYDMGIIQVPLGHDPETKGASGIIQPPRTQNVLDIVVTRTGGSNMRADYCIALPADEEFSMISWGAHNSALRPTLDGPNNAAYFLSSSGVASSAAIPGRAGALPMLTPGSDVNRIYLLDDLTGQEAGGNSIAGSVTANALYWPRWLDIRP